jgi:hypothetical protein
MVFIKGLCLVLSLLTAAIATAIRYDLIAPAIISQLVAGNEFEWMLCAFLLRSLRVVRRRA